MKRTHKFDVCLWLKKGCCLLEVGCVDGFGRGYLRAHLSIRVNARLTPQLCPFEHNCSSPALTMLFPTQPRASHPGCANGGISHGTVEVVDSEHGDIPSDRSP